MSALALLACAYCFGDPNSPASHGQRWAVAILGGATLVVLGVVAWTVRGWARRAGGAALALAAASLLASCAGGHTRLGEAEARVVTEAERVTVFRVRPEAVPREPRPLRSPALLDPAVIVTDPGAPATEEWIARLRAVLLDEHTYGGAVKYCRFDPCMAVQFVRGDKRVEVLFSFAPCDLLGYAPCDTLAICTREGRAGMLADFGAKDPALAAEVAALAREAFPKDAEIQGLR